MGYCDSCPEWMDCDGYVFDVYQCKCGHQLVGDSDIESEKGCPNRSCPQYNKKIADAVIMKMLREEADIRRKEKANGVYQYLSGNRSRLIAGLR